MAVSSVVLKRSSKRSAASANKLTRYSNSVTTSRPCARKTKSCSTASTASKRARPQGAAYDTELSERGYYRRLSRDVEAGGVSWVRFQTIERCDIYRLRSR